MMTREQIVKYLRQLGAELSARGLRGEVLLAGGAAMCLVHEARDATKDIDALYEPKELINQVAGLIAERESLPKGWLNDGVKGFIGKNAPTEDYISFDGLLVQTVSAEYLLAMKLMSARYGERDHDDIRFLFGKLGIRTAEEAKRIVIEYFPENQILPKTQYLIEELISETKEKYVDKPGILGEGGALAAAKTETERRNGEQVGRGKNKDNWER
jgi:hypothetical protein